MRTTTIFLCLCGLVVCPTTAHYVAPQRIATAPSAAAAAAAAPPAAAAASHPTAAIDQKKNDGAFRDDLPSFSRPPHVAAQATTVTDGKPMLQLSAMDASRTIAPSSTPQYHPRHITTTATNHVKNEYTTTAYTKTATTFTAITKTKTTTTEMLCQKNMYYMPATAKTPAACKDCPEKSELLKVHHQWECCKCISGYTGYPRCVSTTTATTVTATTATTATTTTTVTATTKTKTTTTKSTTTVTSKTTTSVTTVTATTKTKTTTSKTTVTTTTKTTKTTTKATKTKTTTTTTKTTTKRKPTTTQHVVTRAHFKDFKMKGCGECVGAGPSFPALKNGSCPWVKPGQCMQILKPPNILMKVIPAYFLNASGNDTAHACQAICTGISAVCTGFTLYKNNTKNGINSCKLHGYFKDPVKKWVDNYLAGCKDCFTYTPGVLSTHDWQGNVIVGQAWLSRNKLRPQDHSIECWINGASSPLQTTHKKKRTTTITTTTSVISPGPPPAPNPGPPPPPPPTPVQPSESTAHKIIALLSVVGACLAMLVIVAMVAGQ